MHQVRIGFQYEPYYEGFLPLTGSLQHQTENYLKFLLFFFNM